MVQDGADHILHSGEHYWLSFFSCINDGVSNDWFDIVKDLVDGGGSWVGEGYILQDLLGR